MTTAQEAGAYFHGVNPIAREIETTLLAQARQVVDRAKRRHMDSRGASTVTGGVLGFGGSQKMADDEIRRLYMVEDRIDELESQFKQANAILGQAGHELWKIAQPLGPVDDMDRVRAASVAAIRSVEPTLVTVHGALRQIIIDFTGYVG